MQQQTRHACTPDITRTHRRGRGLVGHRQQRAPRAAARGRGHALERAAAAAAAQLGHQRRGHPGARVCRRVVWSANRIEALLADSLRSDTSHFSCLLARHCQPFIWFFFFLIVSRIKNSKQGAYFWGRHGQVGDALPLTKSSAATFPLARETPASVEGRLAACIYACLLGPAHRQTYSHTIYRAQRARSGRHARPAARAAARGPREGAKAAPAGLSARRAVQVAAARGATAANIQQKFSCRAFAMGNETRGPLYPLLPGRPSPGKGGRAPPSSPWACALVVDEAGAHAAHSAPAVAPSLIFSIAHISGGSKRE